ncbi:hypothetical protein KIW84_043599 [Lathyrus oleraceus]|uniref:Cytochrome P450 n=2 Tax=Pisum sativum TaxID=3888 RepID=A0A9D4XHV8_PEA|nr:hypothetical protein KIW84_043599 [Pisum sativum]
MTAFFITLISLVFLIITLKLFFHTTTKFKNLPPGPPFLPVIGNLHQLKQPLHHTFQTLSQKYGQIFSLWFGYQPVVVVSSSKIAQECFTKHDIVLANRPDFLVGKYISYNNTTVALASYGDHWRNLRRIVTTELLSSHRLNSFLEIRRDEIMRLIKKLTQVSYNDFSEVELTSMFSEMTFNTIMRMVSGKRYYGDDSDVTDIEEARLFRNIIKEILGLGGASNVMLVAGTDTSSVTLEWAMSNLLNNPNILKKAKDEIDTHIGQDHLVDECDISKLSYLQSIVYETLRLHPAAPLLMPHLSSEEFTIEKYNIPQSTILMVNSWAIHRDPNLWTDPICFKPERFEKEGETNKLLSFGMGRRACPGTNLAQRTVSLTLGLLIQCFEWKRIGKEKIDMTEGNGVTVAKKIPLRVMCKLCHPLKIKDVF